MGTVGRSRGRGEGRGPGARGREERKERERGSGKEREKKRKEKENGKKKKKKKRRGEKREKGERERFAVIPPVATATPVGHARLSRPRAAARRDARVEGKTGFWIRVSGLWGFGRSGGTGKIPETGVRVWDLELNDEAEF